MYLFHRFENCHFLKSSLTQQLVGHKRLFAFVTTPAQNSADSERNLPAKGKTREWETLFKLERDEGNRACCCISVQELCCRCLQQDERNDQASLAEERRNHRCLQRAGQVAVVVLRKHNFANLTFN